MIHTTGEDIGTLTAVKAGFPNAGQATTKRTLSLDTLVVKRPASTFYMRSGSNTLRELGIYTNDLLVIDRALEMRSGDVVVAMIDGRLCLRQFIGDKNRGRLMNGQGSQTPVDSDTAHDVQIWGVVTHSLRSHRGGSA